MKLSGTIYDTLQSALTSRMKECESGLMEIILQEDLETLDGIRGINGLASNNLKKHFSISAYKAMKDVKSKLEEMVPNSELEQNTFDTLELTQLVKAVGSASSNNVELMSWLVDTLVCAIFNEARRF